LFLQIVGVDQPIVISFGEEVFHRMPLSLQFGPGALAPPLYIIGENEPIPVIFGEKAPSPAHTPVARARKLPRAGKPSRIAQAASGAARRENLHAEGTPARPEPL